MENVDGRQRGLIPDPEVWKRYGVCSMTIWRWDHNPELNFPKPVRINRRKYRYEDELEVWERSRVASTAMQSGPRREAQPRSTSETAKAA